MDPATGRSRARARGRARGQKPAEPARRPSDVPTLPTTAGLAHFQPAIPPPAPQPPQPAGAGRAIHRGGISSETRPGEGAVGGVVAGLERMTIGEHSAGRGAMRGRRAAMEEIHSRPPTCTDKRGTNGQPIELLANYIRVLSSRGLDFIFYQYRVEFSPTVESPKMRRAMLFDHVAVIGQNFIFDGMEDLKTANRLERDVKKNFSKD